MLTLNIYYLIPTIFVAAITACLWRQTCISHIKLLESGTHVMNVLLLTKRKRMAHRRRSTIFKKWDLQVTFPAIYKVHTYVTVCIYTCICHVSSALTLQVKPATSVYYCPRAIDTSSSCSAHAST